MLALYLVMLRPAALARCERWALIALIAFSAATHTATLAVLLALLAAGSWSRLVRRGTCRSPGWRAAPSRSRSASRCCSPPTFAVAGRVAWTPGGSAIPFGRMLQAGIVARYLAEHCPDPRLPKLCANRDKLPDDADFFFWGSDLFDELGRFEGLGEEMRIVVRESLTAYPARSSGPRSPPPPSNSCGSRPATACTPRSGTPTGSSRLCAASLPAMKAARQQRGELELHRDQPLHVPVAWGSMLLLVTVLALAARRREFAELGGWPRSWRWRSSPMRRSAARSPIRTTATAPAWSGWRRWRCCSLRGCAVGSATRARRLIRTPEVVRAQIKTSRIADVCVPARQSPPFGPSMPPFPREFPNCGKERDFKVTRVGELHPLHQFSAI